MGERQFGVWQIKGPVELAPQLADLMAEEVKRAVAEGKEIIAVDGVTLVWKPLPDSLDAARAEVETALPEGRAVQIGLRWEPGLSATAWAEDVTTLETLAEVEGPTPAAALRALAAKLRGEG